MCLGVIDDRIQIRCGLDVVVGWHGWIMGKCGWDCQDGFGQGTLWSLIGYGVHFQTFDGASCDVGLFLDRPEKSLLQMIGRWLPSTPLGAIQKNRQNTLSHIYRDESAINMS
jgi:hypothetical protein